MMRKIPGLFILLCVCTAALLNSGTVRRKQSAVSKTQTEGIKLKDKLEELKDGEKGPATPSFGWYGGKNGFMSDPPFSKEKPAGMEEHAVPPVSEVELPQQGPSEDTADSQKNEVGWDDEDGLEGGSAGDVKEDESLSVKADTEEDVDLPDSDLPAESDTSKDKKASKWDKDWWDEI